MSSPDKDQNAGLDEMVWEPPALQVPAASSSDTAKHPVLSPGYKIQPVVKAAPVPKAASGVDPLTGAPAPVDERQLKELGVRLAAPPEAR